MIRVVLLAAAAALFAAPANAQETAPPEPAPQGMAPVRQMLSLEHRMLVRCSAAFALVAHRQASGDAAAMAYEPLDARGKEYFVRASARVMEEANLDRGQIMLTLAQEAEELTAGEALKDVMPACNAALESAGL